MGKKRRCRFGETEYRAGTESRVVGKGGKSREVCNFGGWVIIFGLSTFKRPKRKDFYAVAVGPKSRFSVCMLGKTPSNFDFQPVFEVTGQGGVRDVGTAVLE